MHAVILAGGKGVRLRPYTTALPKPLVPIGDEHAILEIVLRQLSQAGFTHCTLAIGHLGEIIRAYVGDGSQWGLSIDYATEENPLGTMGPLLNLRDRLPEHFLVMNGDVLTDLDYADVLRRHETSGAPLTIATYARKVHIDFGVLTTDDSRVVAFTEKPSIDYRVSMGCTASRGRPSTPTPRGSPRLRRAGARPARRRDAPARLRLRRLLAGHRPSRRLRPGQRGVHQPQVPPAQGSLNSNAHPRPRRRRIPGRPRHRAAARPPGRAGPRRRPFPGADVAVDLAADRPYLLAGALAKAAPDAVVNCAGATGGDAVTLAEVNARGPAALCAALREAAPGARLVHLGSAAEYGPGTPGLRVTESEPCARRGRTGRPSWRGRWR